MKKGLAAAAMILLLTCGWVDRRFTGLEPQRSELQRPDLVDRFYQHRGGRLFWFTGKGPDGAGDANIRQLLRRIDSAAWFGLDSTAYHPGDLRAAAAAAKTDSLLIAADRRFTDVALSLSFDLWRGTPDAGRSYDGVSPKFESHDEEFILDGLDAAGAKSIEGWLARLQPPAAGYDSIRAALWRSIDSADDRRYTQLAHTLNTLRFIRHFGFGQFIVVNIPSAALRYYVADSLVLWMRVVAGQTSKRTPRFAAWCNGLVLYPYWNIPGRIATREMLPLLRKAPAAAALLDLQVLDRRGHRIDPATIDWKTVSAGDFPYTLRQAPGCENALGVLKFELSDPFNVYMHDTNLKRAFGAGYRYLSHGCIRLEKAAQLGDLLLGGGLDTAFLSACLRDQQPKAISLPKPVPVFVVYLTAIPDTTGRVSWYKDIYHLGY